MTDKISVEQVIQNPKNRYESLMIMSCGHWFAAKTGDAYHEGAEFNRSQCGFCAAQLMLTNTIKYLESGTAKLRAENDAYFSAYGPLSEGFAG